MGDSKATGPWLYQLALPPMLFCHRECPLIPPWPTSQLLHRVGLLPGISSRISLPGKCWLIFPCSANGHLLFEALLDAQK